MSHEAIYDAIIDNLKAKGYQTTLVRDTQRSNITVGFLIKHEPLHPGMLIQCGMGGGSWFTATHWADHTNYIYDYGDFCCDFSNPEALSQFYNWLKELGVCVI